MILVTFVISLPTAPLIRSNKASNFKRLAIFLIESRMPPINPPANAANPANNNPRLPVPAFVSPAGAGAGGGGAVSFFSRIISSRSSLCIIRALVRSPNILFIFRTDELSEVNCAVFFCPLLFNCSTTISKLAISVAFVLDVLFLLLSG